MERSVAEPTESGQTVWLSFSDEAVVLLKRE
jgi:hypothetical protein